MNLLQVVPDELYFHWQLWAQMLNFRKYNLEDKAIILVALKRGKKPSFEIKKFEKWTKARVYYYEDTRLQGPYASSIRPHCIRKFYESGNPISEHVFYHDSDIIFTQDPKFDELPIIEGLCYTGDTLGYTGYNYLQMFPKYIYYTMCEIGGVNPDLFQANDSGNGGAQYFLNGCGLEFWSHVERICDPLYKYLQHITEKGLTQWIPDLKPPTYNVQIWCADMWAILFAILKTGKKSELHHKLNFVWPFDSKEKAAEYYIMHNAGITAKSKIDEATGLPHLFYKGEFHTKMPWAVDLSYVKEDTASKLYVDAIKEAEKEYFAASNLTISNQNPLKTMRKFKFLGVWCSTNTPHPKILQSSLDSIKAAAEYANSSGAVEVEIITCTWEPIADNPFQGLVTPFRGLGHLNYMLQIMTAMQQTSADIVSFLEHDCMYPKDYFNKIAEAWSGSHYGVTYDNYIGLSSTGWVGVKERHQPMSMISLSWGYAEKNFDAKIREYLRRQQDPTDKVTKDCYPMGWCCVEPDNKADLVRIPPCGACQPAVHINTNSTKIAHHFTGHADCCYYTEGEPENPHWGNFTNYFPVEAL